MNKFLTMIIVETHYNESGSVFASRTGDGLYYVDGDTARLVAVRIDGCNKLYGEYDYQCKVEFPREFIPGFQKKIHIDDEGYPVYEIIYTMREGIQRPFSKKRWEAMTPDQIFERVTALRK